jgi:hypothetical protein
VRRRKLEVSRKEIANKSIKKMQYFIKVFTYENISNSKPVAVPNYCLGLLVRDYIG